jgi:Kef-type K+ transport system membrane component KefB
MTFLLSIFVLLLLAIIMGSVFEYYGLPSVIGELIAGFILGKAVLDLVLPSSIITGISEISLFFIVLLIGVESTTYTLVRNVKKGILLSATSFIIPLLIMLLFLKIFYGKFGASDIILAVSIGVPSISIISVLLNKYDLMKYEMGNSILASVIFTDIIAFIILSAIVDLKRLNYELVSIVVFLILIFLADHYLRKNSKTVMAFFERLRYQSKSEKLVFGSIILSGLIVASILDEIGISYVLGAFFAGILISDVIIGKELLGIITRTLGRLNDSFFIPLFFSIAGMEAILPTFNSLGEMTLLIIITILIGGFLDYYAGRKFFSKGSGRVSSGILGGRGAVGVIIATIALEANILNSNQYSAAIFATIIVSVIFSFLLRNQQDNILMEQERFGVKI